MYSLLIQFPLFSWFLDRLFHHYYVYVIHCGVVGNMQASHVCAPGSIPGNGTFLSTSIKLFKTQRRKKEKKEKKRKRKGKKRKEKERKEKKREWMKTNKQTKTENQWKHWKTLKKNKTLKIIKNRNPLWFVCPAHENLWLLSASNWFLCESGVAQWQRGRLITCRSIDRNFPPLLFFKVKKLWKQTKTKPNQNKIK